MIPGTTASPFSVSSRTSPCDPATPATNSSPGPRNGLACWTEIPMLILWGMKDFVFDHHFLDEWLQRFPRRKCIDFRPPATICSRMKPRRSMTWCAPSSRCLRSSGSMSVDSNFSLHRLDEHRRPPDHNGAPRTLSVGRCGSGRAKPCRPRSLYAFDLSTARQDSDRIACGLRTHRNRPRYPRRGDGPPRPRLLFAWYSPCSRRAWSRC